jgi:hypothetical protein
MPRKPFRSYLNVFAQIFLRDALDGYAGRKSSGFRLRNAVEIRLLKIARHKPGSSKRISYLRRK